MTRFGFEPKSRVAAVVDGPVTMLFLCVCGMAIGLAIDCGSVPPDVLASLCLARATSLTGGLAAHVALLPATHALMLAGAFIAGAMMDAPPNLGGRRSAAAMVVRHLPSAIGAAAMLAGMVVGGFLAPPLVAGLGVSSGFARLLVAMVLGMTAGMALVTPLYRIRIGNAGASRQDNPMSR